MFAQEAEAALEEIEPGNSWGRALVTAELLRTVPWPPRLHHVSILRDLHEARHGFPCGTAALPHRSSLTRSVGPWRFHGMPVEAMMKLSTRLSTLEAPVHGRSECPGILEVNESSDRIHPVQVGYCRTWLLATDHICIFEP